MEVKEIEKASSELADQLKVNIDRNGQFSRSLDDMAAGLAAGTGIRHMDAKQHINEQFKAKFEQTPYDYLNGVRTQKGASDE